jgi:hypothetical protein
MKQFGDYGPGGQYLTEDFRQELDLTDHNEVADRRSVGDGEHYREASRMAAMSRSRSSMV